MLSCLYIHPFICSPTNIENDRKSNIDVLEANKNSNKEEIKRLRDENKELRLKYSQLQKVGAVALPIR
jgi:hypothetical protein